jgi:nitroimidazol reductase NimA-like FMN-containing flavoprotein (pyridoxamine 5'-phosphate oxidase superfamily)
MPSRRDAIAMSVEEAVAFLDSQPFGVLATTDGRGDPHLVNIGYSTDGLEAVYMTSFPKAQKVVNIERNPRAGLLVEHTMPYGEIRGVLLRGSARVVRDRDQIAHWYHHIKQRSAPLLPDDNLPPVDDEALISKRLLIALDVDRVSTWDHRKLHGVY